MLTDNALVPRITAEEISLLKNWNAILARSEPHTQSIRILDGVATIITPTVIIRSPRHKLNFPNGFYIIDSMYNLIPDDITLRTKTKKYPDVECFRPEFPQPLGELDRDTMGNIIVFLGEEAPHYETIRLYGQQLMSSSGRNFALPFRVPTVIEVHALSLKLALIELLRYDKTYVARSTSQPNSPLILGFGWDKCAILAAQG